MIEPNLQPIHHSGLIAVTAGLTLHLLIVCIITILFLSRTKLSFIEESWHTVVQLHSTDVILLLEETSLMRDEEVEKLMLGREKSGEIVLGNKEGAKAHEVRRDTWI